MDAAPERARRGITLLEAGLAVVLLLGAGGFAAWRVTAPKRLLKTLQQDLRLDDAKKKNAAADQIFRLFLRDGMAEEEVRALFAPLTLLPSNPGHPLGLPPGHRATGLEFMLGSPDERFGGAFYDFGFDDGKLRTEWCHSGDWES